MVYSKRTNQERGRHETELREEDTGRLRAGLVLPCGKGVGHTAELIGQLPAPVNEQEFMDAKAMLDSYGQEAGMMKRVAEEAIRSGRYGWAEAFLRWDPHLLVKTSLNKYLAWQLGSMAATIGREQARRTMDVAIEIFDSKQGLGLTSLMVMKTLTMLFRKTPGLEGELTPEQRQLLEKAVGQSLRGSGNSSAHF